MPRFRMGWPLPALLSWALAWCLFLALQAVQAPWWVAGGLPCVLGALLSCWGATRWRQVFIAAGFPLSWLASGWGAGLPAWAWLVPLLALLAVYPLNAWRDAPVFPTPVGALRGLDRQLRLSRAQPRIVDAGCGLGDGLRELHAEYPQARLEGIEWSWPLRLLCAWRCRRLAIPARVRRADLWAGSWSVYDLVYLFQRPESMPRALEKAAAEMAAGSWLVSLEFEAAGWRADAVHRCEDGRPVWLYRAPFKRDSAFM